MRYLLVLVLLMVGCSGPQLKKGCDPILNREGKFSCSSDSQSSGCIYVEEKARWVCDK